MGSKAPFQAGLVFFFLSLGLLGGCASSRGLNFEADQFFRAQKYDLAAQSLKKGLAAQGEESPDELLYLLDLGLSLHAAGQYEESNSVLLKADKMAEMKDYTSLAAESATLVVSENLKHYSGEDFEKVLISTYLSMNFALLGQWEDALVEARRVNTRLHLMVADGQRTYKQNAFARYLSATLYEAEGNWNDAYIDYKEVYRLEPTFPGIGPDLYRVAFLGGMRDDLEKWRSVFSLSEEQRAQARAFREHPDWGEVVVLFENGIGPVKVPHRNYSAIPEFRPSFNPVKFAEVQVGGTRVQTAVLHDIERTAIEDLNEKYSKMIAKKVAGVVAKEVIADRIGKQTQPWVGELVRWIAYLGDLADCRSWRFLPKDLQVARIAVPAGTHTVKIFPNGVGYGGGAPSEKTVQVSPGKKVFVNFRFLP